MMSTKNFILPAAVIVLVTLGVYLPAMGAGYIWDDPQVLTQNLLVKAGDGLRRLWFTTEPRDYFPLTYTSFWFEWRLWGPHPAGYHVANILLHAASAVLVWRVLERLRVPGAWLAGLLFAAHPVTVASVAWIAERKNTLSLALYLLSLLLYLRFESSGKRGGYILSLIVFLLALFSKTSVVMLPVVLLGCAWWQRGRIDRKDLMRSLPFFALAGALAIVGLWFQGHRIIGHMVVRPEGFFSRLAGAGWAVWFYLYKALLPISLSMVYPRWNVNAAALFSYLPGLVLLACLGLFWRFRKSWGRPLLFAFGYFVVTLFPVLGFFDISFMRYSLVADHWQYVSLIGVVALVSGAAVRFLERRGEAWRDVGVALAVAAVFVLGALTWRHSMVYQSEETLWRDTLSKNPKCWVGHNNLASALIARGEVEKGVEHYREAIRANPNYAEPHYNLGNIRLAQGKVAEAISHYREVLRIEPDDAEVRQRLAEALAQQKAASPPR